MEPSYQGVLGKELFRPATSISQRALGLRVRKSVELVEGCLLSINLSSFSYGAGTRLAGKERENGQQISALSCLGVILP